MGSLLRQTSKWFWSENVWLPPNITWSDLKPSKNLYYAQTDDLYYALPIAAVFIVVRLCLERLIWHPVGIKLGLKAAQPRRAPENVILERVYQTTKRVSHKQIQGISKQLDWTERQVERWFRKRRIQDKPPVLVKFKESGWRMSYYTFAFIYGCYSLWNKSWLWDIFNCWLNYPHHHIPTECWWHYMLSLGFYWSLVFSQFTDIRRKDFWEMFIHHLLTISLLSFSWVCNLIRVGTLVLVVHDVADILLEAAKLAIYSKKRALSNTIFITFALTWIITRLGIFPAWIVYSTSVSALEVVPTFPAYYIFNGLLIGLLILHVIWTYFILKMAYNTLQTGKIMDSRSSSEDVSSDVAQTNNHATNNSGSSLITNNHHQHHVTNHPSSGGGTNTISRPTAPTGAREQQQLQRTN